MGSNTLAGIFNTSLNATSMKSVHNNKHECILVLSKGKSVAWAKQQGNRFSLQIEKGMSLHDDSLAFHAEMNTSEMGPEVTKPEAWISHNAFERKIEVTEQSWARDGYDSVLTLG